MREARVLVSPAMAPVKGGGGSSGGGSPVAKQSGSMAGEDRWRDPDGSSSVSAVSFGFVATAILVSMFLFMALFEHFLRPRSVGGESTGGERSGRRRRMRLWGRSEGADLEANKLCFPSPEVSSFSSSFGFSPLGWVKAVSPFTPFVCDLLTCQLYGLNPVIFSAYYSSAFRSNLKGRRVKLVHAYVCL